MFFSAEYVFLLDVQGLLTFGRYGRSAPNLLRIGFPINFSLLALICFCKSSLVARTSEGVVG